MTGDVCLACGELWPCPEYCKGDLSHAFFKADKTRPEPSVDVAPYILWIDGGTEGWHPECFQHLDEMIRFIQKGSMYGKFVVTRRLELSIKDLDLKTWVTLGPITRSIADCTVPADCTCARFAGAPHPRTVVCPPKKE